MSLLVDLVHNHQISIRKVYVFKKVSVTHCRVLIEGQTLKSSIDGAVFTVQCDWN